MLCATASEDYFVWFRLEPRHKAVLAPDLTAFLTLNYGRSRIDVTSRCTRESVEDAIQIFIKVTPEEAWALSDSSAFGLTLSGAGGEVYRNDALGRPAPLPMTPVIDGRADVPRYVGEL